MVLLRTMRLQATVWTEDQQQDLADLYHKYKDEEG